MSVEYDRLFDVAKRYFGGVSQLSLKLGKTKNFLGVYKYRNGFGKKVLLDLERIGINPKYITDGKEPMLLTDPQKEKPEPNVAAIEEVEMITVPDITKMSLEEMLKWKKEALKAIEKIDKVQDALGGE